VQNALAAVAIAREMGVDDAVLKSGFDTFEGVKRRFTKVGTVDGISIIDDYAHHPVEISAVLSAARGAVGDGQVIAVVQPHRYTRLRDLFEDFCTCFNDADAVLVADVFEAGETPLEGYDREHLVAGLREHGHRMVLALESPDDLAAMVNDLAKDGDMVVCAGAGSISQWAATLPEELRKLRGSGTCCLPPFNRRL